MGMTGPEEEKSPNTTEGLRSETATVSQFHNNISPWQSPHPAPQSSGTDRVWSMSTGAWPFHGWQSPTPGRPTLLMLMPTLWMYFTFFPSFEYCIPWKFLRMGFQSLKAPWKKRKKSRVTFLDYNGGFLSLPSTVQYLFHLLAFLCFAL